jgi:hypothetical protein
VSLPYPSPEPIKTKRRCQFSLPGQHYDCRRVGTYVLNSKGYCAPHYDTAWKVANPEIGQQHDWHIRKNHITGEPYPYPTCRRCGAIKVHDGLPQCVCRGKMPQITLRGEE